MVHIQKYALKRLVHSMCIINYALKRFSNSLCVFFLARDSFKNIELIPQLKALTTIYGDNGDNGDSNLESLTSHRF